MSRAAQHSESETPGRHGRRWELLTLIHVGVLLVFSSWAFGGGATWARQGIAAWASLSVVILVGLAIRGRSQPGGLLPLRALWPLAAYAALVLASTLNPSFTPKQYEGGSYLAFTGAAQPLLPSTVDPTGSAEHLWLFLFSFLSAFNLLLAVRHRRALRTLLLVFAANAALLAVFGTFQRFTADGLFFGLVPAPNARFFSTFVYGNHWAAYVLLPLAATAGLLFHRRRRDSGQLASQSPLALGLVALLLMAITPTLAGSRAGTLLVLVFLGGCALSRWRELRRQESRRGGSAVAAMLVTALIAALVVAGTVYLGRDVVQERWRDTRGEWQRGIAAERIALYRDTWKLAAAEPWFGWGAGSFDKTLQLLRPRPLAANRQYEHSYVDAHSDWLQSLAEVGWIGTLLIGLTALLPLRQTGVHGWTSPIPACLLGACGLVVGYALVEFPFGNPAVVIAWWVSFFTAVHYVRLRRREPAVPAR